MDRTEFRRAVLDLGLEDLIPLWEIASDCEVIGARAVDDAVERQTRLTELVETLVDLLHSRRIRVFVGAWQESDPPEIAGEEAETLLRDLRRYSVEAEVAKDLHRVYYVNVGNLPNGEM